MSVLKSRRMATQEKRLLNLESIMLVAYAYIIYIFNTKSVVEIAINYVRYTKTSCYYTPYI